MRVHFGVHMHQAAQAWQLNEQESYASSVKWRAEQQRRTKRMPVLAGLVVSVQAQASPVPMPLVTISAMSLRNVSSLLPESHRVL